MIRKLPLLIAVCIVLLSHVAIFRLGLDDSFTGAATAQEPSNRRDIGPLERQLREMDPNEIAAHVRLRGDPQRGALAFFKSAGSCAQCHVAADDRPLLGPDLTQLGEDTKVSDLVEAILDPSRTIREGFETVSILTTDGEIISGMLVEQTEDKVTLRKAAESAQTTTISQDRIEQLRKSNTSMMPAGLVAALADEHRFYDLIRYLHEIAVGGRERAAELRPSDDALRVVDDIQDLDHAGILGGLGTQDFDAGKRIFTSHCANCHGVDGDSPTMPAARAFRSEKLKYGAGPYKMLLTLSRGAGLMAPVSHLSPNERYQVIHYVREGLMKGHNLDYAPVDEAYLQSLPAGKDRGERSKVADRDYGPVLASQLGSQVNNGLTFRLPDGVTVCYDLHRMRLGAVWQGGFLDLSETHHYRQRGERMPQIDGQPIPGLSQWQWAFDGRFEIPSDAKPPRGPVQSDWLQYHGHYLHGDRAILSYAIQGRNVLESIDAHRSGDRVALMHTLHVKPGEQPLQVSVGRLQNSGGPSGLLAPNARRPVPFSKGTRSPADRHGQIAVITGSPEDPDLPLPNRNRPRHVVTGDAANKLDLGTTGRTTLVRFRTQHGGTLVASTPAKGKWKPDGKSLFVRGGRLVYDIGWVGAMTSRTQVADGHWHLAALVVDEQETRLYVDGQLEATREEFRREPVDDFVLKVGATATNFGGDFKGDIDWLRIHERVYSANELEALAALPEAPSEAKPIFAWAPKTTDADARKDEHRTADAANWGMLSVTQVLDDHAGMTWHNDEAGRLVLMIPPSDRARTFRIVRATLEDRGELGEFRQTAERLADQPPVDLPALTEGGPERWPEILEFSGTLGEPINGYALDTIPVPFENPWNAWLRTSALDFFDDGRAVVTTHGGDVYLVTGIDDSLQQVRWKRFAAGLFEPFGVRVVDGTIYVTCRDGIKRLHDFDDNGEADFIEAFWIDDDVSASFHAYNFDLQTDSEGNFYFAKAGQFTQHRRPGTILRVPSQGGSAEVVAWGLRTPNGMGKLPGDRFTVSDNQGAWIPAGKISLVQPGAFFGSMPINQAQTDWLTDRHGGQLPETFEPPIVWTPQELDNSCGGQVWAGDQRFGPLAGRMIHSSFGKGWLYAMPLQEVGSVMQGALIALPHQWRAGVMRLRISPADGQLYGTGLSGWQGPRDGLDGCFQRLRFAGGPVQMVDDIKVIPGGLELTTTFDVDIESASDRQAWSAEMWNYLWSARYGSDQYSVRDPQVKGHDALTIEQVEVLGPRRLRLRIPDLAPCDQLQLHMLFEDTGGKPFSEKVYLTIHNIPENPTDR